MPWGRAPPRLGARAAGLPQREVARRALERPAAVLVEVLRERRRERLEGVLAGEVGRAGVLESELVVAVVGDVLADPFLAAAVQMDGRRSAREAGRHVEGAWLQLAPIDDERQLEQTAEAAHADCLHRS